VTRFLYGLLWLAAAPLALARLAWRRGVSPATSPTWANGLEPMRQLRRARSSGCHAVSVGETRAAAPIVEALSRRHPGHRILITHMTPTGRATGLELFGDRVSRAWLPYDMAFAVRRFLAHYRPAFGIVLETEIWPRLLEECARARVARWSSPTRACRARSARRYARFPALTRWALGNLGGIAAQSEADAQRFRELGAGMWK
jgi:3-deoxy-D-manno-octulosonic-acid transferase